MPKVTPDDQRFPAWSETQHYGIARHKIGAEVELHFHDCHEYWIIVEGAGIAVSEGIEYRLGPGDLLLTEAGQEHSLVVTEPMVAIYYYGVMPEHGRWGHLHRGTDLPFADYLATIEVPA
ncbi:MAG TPA: AraC family ligand binding domain-containing protein [Kaistia sp.]|nr:AraC family ligand binding domain-containing protein [Kaistia sp.]